MTPATDNAPTFVSRGRALIDALPLTAALFGVALAWLSWPDVANSDGEVPPLQPIETRTAVALERAFTGYGYGWPAQQVPPVSVQAFPPDLAETVTDTKKSLFFRTLLPLVLAENARIEAQREDLARAAQSGLPDERRREILGRLADEYGVEGDPLADATAAALKSRVNTVPPALALAQAAKESGWGTSRFARQGNNLFGEWTWDASQGMTPRDAAADADHFVRRFTNLRASVRSYLNNLNTHDAYARFRSLRARARAAGRAMTPTEMTGGLEKYSQRGWDYVREVRAMITTNQLSQRVANVRLTPLAERVAQR
ncbi:peptidoglycan hydrolase [Gammaproteobacteria bacterium 2W06]|uniref:glucosaminidase domain-containing protein n=1 Tax=Spiribacter roseus TaxID=1855875 RepID=UPI00083FC144|nr:hypothetical protein BBH56_08405 [Spiribacter roseus]PZA00726.1 peptidoglycan hydrolase [Gammaproteobacteria bacterium 2W06]